MRFLVPVVLFLSAFCYAEAPVCQNELYGFLLGQSKSTLAPLGKPFRAGDHDGWKYLAYMVGEDAYVVFEFPQKFPNQIGAIQATGHSLDMHDFGGIRLEDNLDQLIEKFGQPDTTEDESDILLKLLKYKDRNYTFEVNSHNHVVSIRIAMDRCNAQPSGVPDVEQLKAAILAHKREDLIALLAGDLEIYKGGKTYTFTSAARTEIEKGNSNVMRLLFGEGATLQKVFEAEKAKPDQQIRIYTEGTPSSVAKFPDSKIVKEIVYKYEAGSWRVWEIRFR